MEKRYIAIIELYVWANTDKEAIEQAMQLCRSEDDKNDNSCQLIKLVEQPVATLGNRLVYDATK